MPARIEPLEARQLLSAVTFGDGLARAVNFTDADGTRVTVSLTGGSGEVVFTNDTNTAVDAITINASKSARLTVTAAGGDGRVILEDIAVNGSLTSLMAGTAVLRGALTGDLTTVQLLAATDAVITDSDPGSTLNLTVRNAMVNTTVTSAGKVGMIRAAAWDTAGGVSSLTASHVQMLMITGRFMADVDLGGAGLSLNMARFGTIEGGTWSVAGDVGQIFVTGGTVNWTAALGGNLRMFMARNLSGQLIAGSAGMIRADKMFNASIGLTKLGGNVLQTLSTSSMVNSDLRARGNLGTVIANGIFNSSITIGVGDADDASDYTQFSEEGTIGLFLSQSFGESSLIAARIRMAQLGKVYGHSDTAHPDTVTAGRIDSINFRTYDRIWTGRNPSSGVMSDVHVKILDWPHNFGLPGGGAWAPNGNNSGGGWVWSPWGSQGSSMVMNNWGNYIPSEPPLSSYLAQPDRWYGEMLKASWDIRDRQAEAAAVAYDAGAFDAWDPVAFNELYGGEENAEYRGEQDSFDHAILASFLSMANHLGYIATNLPQRQTGEVLFESTRAKLIATLRAEAAALDAGQAQISQRLAQWQEHPVTDAAEWNQFLADQRTVKRFVGWGNVYHRLADKIAGVTAKQYTYDGPLQAPPPPPDPDVKMVADARAMIGQFTKTRNWMYLYTMQGRFNPTFSPVDAQWIASIYDEPVPGKDVHTENFYVRFQALLTIYRSVTTDANRTIVGKIINDEQAQIIRFLEDESIEHQQSLNGSLQTVAQLESKGTLTAEEQQTLESHRRKIDNQRPWPGTYQIIAGKYAALWKKTT